MRTGLAALLWGVVGVVVTLVGVIAIPKTFVDAHELMCGGEGLLRGTAQLVGDCAKYAKVPSTTIIVKPEDLPSGPVPRAVIYEKQLQNYFVAARDNDEAFLSHLYGEGFRLKSETLCNTIAGHNSYTLSRPEAQAEFRRYAKFVVDIPKCGYGADKVAIDAVVLSKALNPYNYQSGRCLDTEALDRWTMIEKIIEGWIASKGKSPDLIAQAKINLPLLERAKSASRPAYIDACVAAHGSGLKTSPEQRTAGGNLVKYGIRCIPEKDMTMAYLQAHRVGDKIDGMPAREFFSRMCASKIPSPPVGRLDELINALRRWMRA